MLKMTILTEDITATAKDFHAKTARKSPPFHRWFHWLVPNNTPKLSNHIARDIGLTPQELALMRHEWPSVTQRHPHL